MRTPSVPAKEQYRLIMECRKSGLSDQQWCMNHDIKPETFYNWVKRLRQKGGPDLPEATGRNSIKPVHHEVVKIQMDRTAIMEPINSGITQVNNTMEISIGNVHLSIPNGTDPVLLAQTIKVLSEFSC